MKSKTNQKRAQESLSSLAHTLGVSKDQDIVQVKKDLQNVTMAKEQYGFIEWAENLGGCSWPKWQIFPLIRFVLPNKPQKVMVMLNNMNM